VRSLRTFRLIVLATALGANARFVAADAEWPSYFPAGVADAAGAIGCVRTPEGGVEALDLARGRRPWKSEAPARALIVSLDGAFVLEQRGSVLQLSQYEPRAGTLLGRWPIRSGPPAWVSLAEPRGGRAWMTCDLRARRDGATLEIEYVAKEQVATGIAPTPNTTKEARGVMSFALPSGRMEHRAGAELSESPAFFAAAPAGARLHRFHARAADSRLMLGGPPPDVEGVLVSGAERFGFERAPKGDRVIVHRWRAGATSEAPPLVIEAETDAIWPTLDRKHVALRRAREQGFCDVYSLTDGARLAALQRPTDIAVIGGRVLWTTPTRNRELALVATDARKGRTLWRRIVWREGPRGEPVP
jgi:hypothetical protein